MLFLISLTLVNLRVEAVDYSAAEISRLRPIKPSLKFTTAAAFEKAIGQPAVLLDTTNLCFFAPKQRERESQIVFPYLIKAYAALYEIVGVHTEFKMVIYNFPKGNTNGWGGTSLCTIEYDDASLVFTNQPEWMKYRVPHVSGYVEEMAHNFVSASKAQFGWEMIGWSLSAQVSQKVAPNPILAASLRATREEQQRTFSRYVKEGYVFPADLLTNQCDRIHAWILNRAAAKYGSRFWPDFFREIRFQKKPLADAVELGDPANVRNARYQITIDCFDKLRGLNFKEILKTNHISLVTDVKSLHPESPGWNRRLTE